MSTLLPVRDYTTPNGHPVYEGDVYAWFSGDKTDTAIKTFYHVIVWFPEFGRYAWLELQTEYVAFCSMNSQERIRQFSYDIIEIENFFQGEETYQGNIFQTPSFTAA